MRRWGVFNGKENMCEYVDLWLYVISCAEGILCALWGGGLNPFNYTGLQAVSRGTTTAPNQVGVF